VEVSEPVSPCFRFSIPVGLGDDGRGLCVELVLPISFPEESCAEEGLGALPVFSAKDAVVVPVKRAIATTAAPILRCIFTLLIVLRMLALMNAQVASSRFERWNSSTVPQWTKLFTATYVRNATYRPDAVAV